MHNMKRWTDCIRKSITKDFIKGFYKGNGLYGYKSFSKSQLLSVMKNFCISGHLDKYMYHPEVTTKNTYITTVEQSAKTEPGT